MTLPGPSSVTSPLPWVLASSLEQSLQPTVSISLLLLGLPWLPPLHRILMKVLRESPPPISSSHLSILVFPGDVVSFAESIDAGLSPLSPDPFVHVDRTRAFLLASPRQLAHLSVARLCVAGPASPAEEDGGSSAQTPLPVPTPGFLPQDLLRAPDLIPGT